MAAEEDPRLRRVVQASLEAGDKRWSRRFRTCCDSASPALANPLTSDRLRLDPHVWEPFLRRIAARKVLDLRGELEAVAATKCESHMEELLFLALVLAGEREGEGAVITDGRDPTPDDGFASVSIAPQYVVGKYRVDFKVTAGTHTSPSDPKLWWAWNIGTVLVECDGHDFHEKTKEQASHDKRKDRALQAAGFKVFRYTGSDVWNDCLIAAEEVVKEAFKSAEASAPIQTWDLTHRDEVFRKMAAERQKG